MDEGPPSSYLLLAKDTPVFGSDGGVAGKVKEVLCDPGSDIFDGLVLVTAHGDRYLEADQVVAIHERGVVADGRPWMEVMRWLHDHLARLIHPGDDARLEDARDRLAQHEKALRLARDDPRLALEAGVGRPDLPGAYDGGLVDVNHAPAEIIACLPACNAELAGRIVAARERMTASPRSRTWGPCSTCRVTT